MSFAVARSKLVRALAHFSSALAIGVMSMQASYAGPQGGQVTRGEGTIVRPNATTTNINQSSHRIVVDWTSFNVASNETVNFYQPSSTAAALNRISDQNPSQIFGSINANGRVLLANPNGVLFGQSASVNVGSLIASGLDINPDSFMSGDWTFENAGGETGGMVVNHGLLQAAAGGSISLFGGSVLNTGTILANYGSINLAAGERVTIDFDGDGLIQFAVDGAVLENAYGVGAAVSNEGTLRATSGQILMSAAAASDVFAQVVNNSGVISASGVTTDGGRVFLTGTGGDVINTGTITATSDSGNGGEVRVLGDRVGLFGDAVVDVSGATGGGTVLIGGDYQGGDVHRAQQTVISADAVIRADALQTGDGGTVIVWSDGWTRFFGEISARGGNTAGDGGFVEVSGLGTLTFEGGVDTSAVNGKYGTLLLDPTNIIVVAAGGETSNLGDVNAFADPDIGGTDTTINVSAINNAATNVILQATDSITFNSDIAMTNENVSLTAETQTGDIIVNNSITTDNATDANSGGITLIAGDDIFINADLTTGAVTSTSASGQQTGNISLTAAGDITIDAVLATGNITVQDDNASGSISISSTGGTVMTTANGALTTGTAISTGNNDTSTSGGVTVAGANGVTLGATVTTGAASASDDGSTSGSISISSSAGSVATAVAAVLTTGSASGDDQATTSGGVTISGQTGVTLAGNAATGTATADDNATTTTSGAINVTGATGNVAVAGLATGGAISSGAAGNANAGAIAATATAGAVALNGAVISGNASSATLNGVSGDVDITGGAGGISGAGTITTGNATGDGNGTGEFATSGTITLDATGGGIQLSASDALNTGDATLNNDAGTNDSINVGNISLSGDSISSDGATGRLDVSIGTGTRALDATINAGSLTADTSAGTGGIFITSGEDLRIADLDTAGASAQTVDIATTGAANLAVLDMTETLAGDTINLGAATGTLTVNDTAFDAGAGNLVLTGDEINLLGGAGSITGTGGVTLRTSTLTRNIRVGDIADGAQLDITDTDLAALANGFGSITLGRADSTGTLAVDALGVTFNDAIVLEMSSGTISLEGGITTAGDAITLNGAMSLANTGTLSIDATNGGAAAAGANVILNGALTDAGSDSALTVNAGTGGTLDLGSVTTGLGQTYTANNIDLNGTTYQSTMSGAIAFNGSVDLDNGGATTVQTAGALPTDDITFASTIDGTSSLVLQAGAGDIDLGNGVIGGTTPLDALTVNSANSLVIGTATASGAISLTAASIEGSGGDIVLTSTAATIAVNGAVTTAGNDVSLTAATGVVTTGSITTAAAANSGTASGAVGINVTGTGDVSVATIDTSGADSTVDGTSASDGGAITITTTNGSIATTGTITTSGGDFADTNDLTTVDNGGAAGAVTLTANSTGSAADITLGGAITARGGATDNTGGAAGADATVTLDADDDIIGSGGTDVNAGALALTAGGSGGTLVTQVESLTADAALGFNITNTGDLAATLTASGGTAALNNTGTLTTSGAWSADAFDVDASGAITLDHSVTSDNGNVDVASADTTTVNAAVTASAQALIAGIGVTNNNTITGNTGVTINAGSGTFTNTSDAVNQGILSNGGGASSITVIADSVDLQTGGAAGDSAINGGTGTVILRAATAARALNLGSATGALDISNTEIGTVTGALVQLGDTTVTGAVTADNFNAGATNLRIVSSSTIDDVGANTNHIVTAGTLDLQSAGAVGSANDGLGIDVSSVTATVTGASNGITLSANDADEGGSNTTPAGITVGAAGITTNAGNVTLNAADDITLSGGINAGAGTITLAANAAGLDAGAETTAAGAINGAGTLTAAALDLDAASGIGNTIALNTAAANIAADTTSGNIDINNAATAATTVSSLTTGTGTIAFDQTGGQTLAVTTATTSDGGITLTNTGANLTLDSVTAGGAGSISAQTFTSGDILVANVTADGNTVTLTSAGAIEESGADAGADVTAATLDFNAATGIGVADTLEISAASIAADSTAGDIDLANAATAATTITSLTTENGSIDFAQTGAQTLDVQAATTTTSGNIDISNDNASMTAGSGAGITSAGDVTLTTMTGGDVVLADVSGTTVTVTSAGNINDGAATSAVVTATNLALAAATGINSLNIDTATVAATTASGNLQLIDPNALEIGTVGTVSGLTISAGAAGDAISVNAGGALTTTGAAADDINNQFGNINLTGASIGTATDAMRVELNPTNGALNLNSSADIYIESTSNLALGSIVTGGTADEVSITTGAGRTIALTTALTHASLAGDDFNFITGAGGTFDGGSVALNFGTGTLAITADSFINIGTIVASGGVTIVPGTVGATIGLGNLASAAGGQQFTLDNSAILSFMNAGGGTLTIGDALAGNVIIDGVDISTVTNGTLEIVTNGTIADDDVTAGHGFIGGADDTLRLTSNGVIGLTDGLSVNAGNIDVVSSNQNNVDLDIFTDLANVTVGVVTGGAGTIDITQNTDTVAGTRNLAVTNIATTGTVVVTNNTGSITESSPDVAADVTGSSITLTATGGIGAANGIETATNTLTADSGTDSIILNNSAAGAVVADLGVSTSGSISFFQTGGATLDITANTNAGALSLNNTADITVTSATAGAAAADNSDINIVSSGGNVLVGVIDSTGDDVIINAAGTINDDAVDTTTDISSATVTLNSAGGLGATQALELVAQTIDATNTGGGNIVLTNTESTGALINVSIANTAGNISYTHTGASDVLLRDVSTTTSGDISVTLNNGGTGRDIGVIDVTSAGNATINVNGAGGELVIGGLITAANTINVTAAAEIFETDLSGFPGGQDIDPAADFVAATVNLRVTGDGGIGTGTNAIQIDAATVDAQVDGATSGQINIENIRSTTGAVTVNELSIAGAGDIQYAQAGGADVDFQNVTTANGSIALSNDNANLTATLVDANGVGADVNLTTANAGTISLTSVDATDQANIVSAADVIESADTTATEITANTVSISAQTGIGVTANGAIDINAPTVSSLSTNTGGIDVRATGQANTVFTSVTTITDGGITLTMDGGNLGAQSVTASGAGDIDLVATGGDIQLGSINAAGNDVDIDAAGAITDNASDNLADITAATAELTAGTGIGSGANGSIDLSVGTIDLASTNTGGVNLNSLVAATFTNVNTTGAASDIVISGTGDTSVATATTTDGAINISTTLGDLIAGTITAGGTARNVQLTTSTSGNIEIGTVTASGDQVTVDAAGQINDDTGGDDTDADITAATVSLVSRSGTGTADRVEVAATNLTALNNTSSNIVLGILGDVTLSGAISNSAAGGGLDLTAIDGDLNTGTGLLSTNGGAITLTATDVTGTNGNLTVGTGGITTNSAAIVTLNAANDIVLDGAVNANGSTINVNAGDNALETTGDDTGAISGAGVLTAATVNLDAASGIGAAAAINTAATSVSADTADGDVQVANTSGTAVTLTSMTSATGDLSFTQTGAGGLRVGSMSTDGAAVLSATTVINDDATDTTTDITAGSVSLSAGGGIGAVEALELATTDVSANVTVGGAIDLSNTSATDVALTNVTTAAGAVTFVQNGAGDLVASNVNGTTLIDLTAADSGIVTGTIDAGATGNVILDAQNGAISDGNGATVNVIANLLTADATAGIDLDTTIASANLSTSDAGDIVINETDALTLTDVDTADGSITVTSGALVAMDVVAGDADASGDEFISLTSTANIAAGAINAGATGDVTLDAQGGAITDGNGVTTNVTANALLADADGGIDLDTAIASADLSANAAGLIDITETDGITLTDIDTANGAISVVAGGAIVATDVASLTNNAANDILIRSTGAGIAVGAVNAGTAGDVTLDAQNGAITDGNGATVNVTANLLTADATTGIDLDTTIASANLSANAAGLIDITETDGITLTDVDTANGAISVIAGGAIVATDVASQTSSAANDILIRSTGAGIQAGAINAGTAGDVTLDAQGGAITDGNGATTNVTANVLLADADGGIDLDTAIASANLSANAAGLIDINETDGITLTDVDTANGTISIIAGGAVTATDVASLTNNAANDILIRSTGAGIQAGAINAGTAGDVTLDAQNGAITDGNGATVNVIANLLTADATAGIDLDTTIASADLTASGAGDITINETDALTLASVDTNDGSITVTSGALTATSVVAGDANASGDEFISLTSTTNIVAGTINAGATGDVTLDAQGGAITDGGGTVTGDTIDLAASTSIGASGSEINTAANRLDITTATGDAFVVETDGVTLGTVDVGNDFTFDNLTGDILVGSIDVAGTLDLEAQGGSIQDDLDDLLVDITAGAAILTASGDIGGNVLDGSDTDTRQALEINAGTLDLNAADVVITDLGGAPVTLSFTGDNFNFQTANDILVDAITATNDVTLISSAGSINDSAANPDTTADISAGGSVNLEAQDEIGGTAHLDIASSVLSAEVTGSGDIVLNDLGGTTLADITTGNGSIDIGSTGSLEIGAVSASGTVDIDASAGALTDADGNSDVSGTAVTLVAATGIGTATNLINTTATSLDLGTTSNGIFINETDGVDLVAVTAPTFTLTANGDVTDSGTIAVTGVATVGAGTTNDIVLDTATNDFGTVAITSGDDVTVEDVDGLALGASTVSGNLVVTVGGDLTQSGAVNITGTTDINAAGQTVTLSNATNLFTGAITVDALGATLTNNRATNLGASNIGTGGLVVNSTAGNVTQTGALTVAGTTAINAAGRTVTLLGVNDFTGAVSGAATTFSVNDINAIDLGDITATTLNVTADGNITDSGDLNIAGVATLSADAANDIVLDGVNNDFGTVAITNGDDVTVEDIDGLALGASTVSGNLVVTVGGALTQSGAVNVAGTTDINAAGQTVTLSNATNLFTGAITIDALGATLTNDTATNLGASNIGTGGLVVNSTAGNVTQSGVLTVAGTTAINAAGRSVTLLDLNNFTGAVSGAATTFSINDINAIVLGGIAGTTLDVTANGDITDAGAGNIVVSGVSTFTAGAANDITLSGANNFGTVVITSADNATLADTNGITLGNANVAGTYDVTATGMTLTGAIDAASVDFDASSGTGAITQTGGSLIVTGAATFAAGTTDSITLNQAGNDFATVNVTQGGNVALRDANAIVLGGMTVSGTLGMTSNGSITDTGVVDVNGTATFTAGSANDILLDSANDFASVVVTSANDVTLEDTGALTLASIAATGAINVTADGALTATSVITTNGTDAGDINLEGASIAVGTVTASGAGDVDLVATAGSITDSSSMITADDFSFNATGAVGGTTALNTTVAEIVAGQSTAAGDIRINETDNLTVTSLHNANGAIDITAGGAITTANVTATGAFSATGSSIVIGGAGLDVGAVNLDATVSTVTIAAAIDSAGAVNVDSAGLTTITAAGDIVAGGAVTFDGAVQTSGNITTSADAIVFNDTVTLAANVTFDTTNAGLNAAGALIDFNGTLSGARSLVLRAGNGNAGFATVSGLTGIDVDAGSASFGGPVTVGSGGLDVDTAGGTTNLNGDVVTTGGGAVSFNGAVVFTGDRSISAGSGAISLGDASGIGALDLNTSGVLTLSGDIDVAAFEGTGLTGGMIVDGAASIVTANTGIDLTALSDGIQAAAGGGGLTIDAGTGNVALSAVGSTDALDTLSVSGGSISARAVGTSGGQTYNGDLQASGNLTAGGAIDVNGDVTLAQNVVFNGSAIDVAGAINGARALTLTATGGTVNVGGGIGQATALESLAVNAASATVQAVTTTQAQTYSADTSVNGNLTGGSLVFNADVVFPGDVIVRSDTIDFLGGTSSVTGTGELTLIPFTDGADIDFGGTGGTLNINADALQGYDAGLVIGGVFVEDGSGISITTVADEITVGGDFSVGADGYLTVISRGGVTLQEGTISAGTMTLIAVNPTANIVNAAARTSDSLLQVDELVMVAGGQIGDGNDINVVSLSGPGWLEVGSGADDALVNNIGNSMLEAPDPLRAFAIAEALGIDIGRTNLKSNAQNSANREQSGGLADEGFIDPSLFEDIALYEVSGSGIMLPADQSEEEVFDEGPSADCNLEQEDCDLGGSSSGVTGAISPR